MHKFGREFSVAVMENRDGCVSDRVSQAARYRCDLTKCSMLPPISVHVCDHRSIVYIQKVIRKLEIVTPSPELVDAYLAEIAKAYSVPWNPPTKADDGGPEGGIKVSHATSRKDSLKFPSSVMTFIAMLFPPNKTSLNENEKDHLNITLPDVKSDPQSGTKLPDIPPTEDDGKASSDSKGQAAHKSETKSLPAPTEDDFDTLAKRFAALKKR